MLHSRFSSGALPSYVAHTVAAAGVHRGASLVSVVSSVSMCLCRARSRAFLPLRVVLLAREGGAGLKYTGRRARPMACSSEVRYAGGTDHIQAYYMALQAEARRLSGARGWYATFQVSRQRHIRADRPKGKLSRWLRWCPALVETRSEFDSPGPP